MGGSREGGSTEEDAPKRRVGLVGRFPSLFFPASSSQPLLLSPFFSLLTKHPLQTMGLGRSKLIMRRPDSFRAGTDQLEVLPARKQADK